MKTTRREKLIKARLDKGLTRPQLATQIGVSFEHIKSLEYGRVNPSTVILFRLCNALNQSPEELFNDIALP
ncbi:hypothetical protein BJH90_03675 [Bacillus halotolerans]|uniref:helix-turn-helix transcriptional regulator n=1 Tax=Bacillus halotolerans TaxID=260554 RepID=UPI000CD96CB5|nr:helix-turn-helix transcriptional regulator [Bacillus halotolerans]PON02836.1 hypothetical protein BJH90_03675 [Bacillus halotolerans]